MFTLFIGERDHNEIRAAIKVNSENVMDAIAEPIASTHDAQGGNMVIKRLNAGDVVYVESTLPNKHVEGDVTYRYTSFSGVMLYS